MDFEGERLVDFFLMTGFFDFEEDFLIFDFDFDFDLVPTFFLDLDFDFGLDFDFLPVSFLLDFLLVLIFFLPLLVDLPGVAYPVWLSSSKSVASNPTDSFLDFEALFDLLLFPPLSFLLTIPGFCDNPDALAA